MLRGFGRPQPQPPDRYGKVTDPFGHHWSIATHTQDLTPEQMMEGMKAAMGG